jgi:hypothetical protein
MDDAISGVGSTLTPHQRQTLELLAQIPLKFGTDVMARKRQVAAVEADIAEIMAAVNATTDRVLRALGEPDQRDEELPA